MNETTRKTLMSSNKDDWGTPLDLYEELNEEFNFDVDVCASHYNAKHTHYYTKADDALSLSWSNHVCWMNPPYGRGITGKWFKKAYEESLKGATIVGLVPSRTDTSYWHDYVINVGAEVRFLRGRVKFLREDGTAGDAAPFPSAIIVWRPQE
jgi:site-specific DNA-methyltransferase (adenine-specific)